MINDAQTLKSKMEDLNNNEPIKPAQRTKTTNEEILRENNYLLKKILRHYQWQTAFSVLKIIIILIPLIFAYMYLPSILSQVFSQYQTTMNTVNGINSDIQNAKSTNIFDQLKNAQQLLK